ncbi:uncharacterized protein LOC143450217 isoform X1 [Clavelina lepadiformis]|uniref:uncharacterized protein LOC143450217 isoform X1 n=1 Tax=Clavelina lepadiformis TaxID=159417 RepID=UPI004041A36E
MMKNGISFYVNNEKFAVEYPDIGISFNSWLRSQPGLTGTKITCGEGGCGSCVVALQRPSEGIKAVNSCLLPLCSVDGCHVITIEGIGSQREGFSNIQSRIAKFGGSQCGYCTPGFVMSMYSLLEEDEHPTQHTIEDNFDGHICRCTGYRPILDAMKCFACDTDSSLKKKCEDIEDLMSLKCHSKRPPKSLITVNIQSLTVTDGVATWIRPASLGDLKSQLRNLQQEHKCIKLVCGNTASGIYKSKSNFGYFLDIGQMEELRAINNYDDCIELGASVTLSEMIKTLLKHSDESVTFGAVASHLKKVASVPIRNVASWAGNIAMKCQHPDFPSDVCVLLEAAKAKVKVYDVCTGRIVTQSVFGSDGATLSHFNDKVLLSVTLPKLDDIKLKFKTFKVMPRSQNSYAYVAAAFRAGLASDEDRIENCVVVFGGLGSAFARAQQTECYLKGKQTNSMETLKNALNILSDEIKNVTLEKYEYNLALGLFYKFYLSLCDPSKLGYGISSGIGSLVRPLSKGTQTYETDPEIYPISQAMSNISSDIQASGEVQYVGDETPTTDELFCTFVLSDVANAEIKNIDYSIAKDMPGFVKIITGENFPMVVKNHSHYDGLSECLAKYCIQFAGQPVAIVIAESREQSKQIAESVKVTYKNVQKPVLSVQDAIENNSFYPNNLKPFQMGNPDVAFKNAEHVVSGEVDLGSQYHFYMENQICRAECTENGGFKLNVATQAQLWIQKTISHSFGIPSNKIEITTKRLGGGFGGKLCNSTIAGMAATLAAFVTRRPVCFHADLKTCMSTFGSRMPYFMKYKIGFNANGIVNCLSCDVYGNCGSAPRAVRELAGVQRAADSAYFCPNQLYKCYACKTNIPAPTWCRAPGSLQLNALGDIMMEHVASYLGQDPIGMKFANLFKNGQITLQGNLVTHCQIRNLYQNLMESCGIRSRQETVKSFNEKNRWKKRGLSVSPSKFNVKLTWQKYAVLVSIYAFDGSVVISHGGIECGQGINTKVAQVAACKLGVPLELITVQRTSNISAANSTSTGGSTSSEMTCASLVGCCEILNSRIEPIKARMNGKEVTWKELIAKCYAEDVDLSATYTSPTLPSQSYATYGVACAEVEYDVLTGENQILRADIMFDCGISMNPSVDIGQVEGAFVMGIGFWTTEEMKYDTNTGQLVTDSTWEYKPPTTKDIPVEFNVELLKNAPNPLGVLRTKAIGEPPICTSICVAIALKRAVEETKRDRGLNEYFPLPTPATVKALHNACELDPLSDFNLS